MKSRPYVIEGPLNRVTPSPRVTVPLVTLRSQFFSILKQSDHYGLCWFRCFCKSLLCSYENKTKINKTEIQSFFLTSQQGAIRSTLLNSWNDVLKISLSFKQIIRNQTASYLESSFRVFDKQFARLKLFFFRTAIVFTIFCSFITRFNISRTLYLFC